MSTSYVLDTRGLIYLISSADPCAIRHYLFYILMQSAEKSLSMEQLLLWKGLSQKKLTQLVLKMIDLGWLKNVDENYSLYDDNDQSKFLNELSELSSTGHILLADARGLLLSSRGFDKEKAGYLAASASRLLSINEISRLRNMDLYNGKSWGITMHWGAMHVRTQYICLGSFKFILAIGGKSRLEIPAFTRLLTSLARRYVHE